MNKLISLVTTVLTITIGFVFWKTWKEKQEEDMAFREEEEWEEHIGAPKPIIESMEEEETEDSIFRKIKLESEEELEDMSFEEEEEEILEEAPPMPEMVATDESRDLEEVEEDFEWHIANYQINEMWTDTTGENIKVVVLDSGILHTHPDLTTADCKDFVGDAGDATDTDGHGTHCAGIIAANGQGEVIGVAPRIELYVAKVAVSDIDVTNERVLKALKWAVNRVKADIVVMCFTLRRKSTDIEELLADAKDKIMFVGAVSKSRYLATYDGCFGVGHIGDDKLPHEDFHKFKAVSIVAPGIDIKSTFIGDPPSYKTESGSSMATAYTAGVLALLKSYAKANNLDILPNRYFEILEETAEISEIEREIVGEDESETKIISLKIIQPLAALNELKNSIA